MQSKEKIIVDFDENGNPTVSVEGVKGRSCKDLTAALEKALGKVTSDKTTAEYTQQPSLGLSRGNQAVQR